MITKQEKKNLTSDFFLHAATESKVPDNSISFFIFVRLVQMKEIKLLLLIIDFCFSKVTLSLTAWLETVEAIGREKGL